MSIAVTHHTSFILTSSNFGFPCFTTIQCQTFLHQLFSCSRMNGSIHWKDWKSNKWFTQKWIILTILYYNLLSIYITVHWANVSLEFPRTKYSLILSTEIKINKTFYCFVSGIFLFPFFFISLFKMGGWGGWGYEHKLMRNNFAMDKYTQSL